MNYEQIKSHWLYLDAVVYEEYDMLTNWNTRDDMHAAGIISMQAIETIAANPAYKRS